MKNIWSENKYINMAINILLFLMATNFLHFGYLLLPIICILLFVDNKFSFKVNNIKVFVLLCIFGITFLTFSFKLGFYSFIGLFLPMAHYIGSNIKNTSEDSIKHLIYLIMFGMATHVLLNFVCDYMIDGTNTFYLLSHHDFWTQEKISTTQTATNYIFMFSIFYYLIIYEKKLGLKLVYYIVFILLAIYEIALARRTPVFILLCAFMLSFIIDIFIIKNREKKVKIISAIFIIASIIAIIWSIKYIASIYNKEWYADGNVPTLFRKLYFFGVGTSRFDIFMDAVKIAPQHLWGGQEISVLFDINIHDLWMDTFDYAGIIPYILLIMYSIYCLISIIKTLKNTSLTKSFRLLIFVLFVCITIQMFLEPIMTGSVIFLLCSIIVFTAIECLNLKKV